MFDAPTQTRIERLAEQVTSPDEPVSFVKLFGPPVQHPFDVPPEEYAAIQVAVLNARDVDEHDASRVVANLTSREVLVALETHPGYNRQVRARAAQTIALQVDGRDERCKLVAAHGSLELRAAVAVVRSDAHIGVGVIADRSEALAFHGPGAVQFAESVCATWTLDFKALLEVSEFFKQ